MADGSSIDDKNGKKRPRIAFTGEEFGYGYIATGKFVHSAAERGRVADGGYSAAPKTTNLKEIEGRRRRRDRFEFKNGEPQHLPLRSKEQALLAVKSGQADFAVVPFYNPYSGYDYETLRAMSNLFTLMAVEQYQASDEYCLAVYEPQVLDLVQSSHPGSGLSELLRHQRAHWGTEETVRTRMRPGELVGGGENFRAGLKIDQSGQMLLRDRVDMVFCGPEAARRCKSKLDGLRAAGVDVAETLRSVEPHREMARLARATLNPNRLTNTYFNPTDGSAHYVSTMNGEAMQSAKLYGVVLPFQVAMMSPDFTIIDTNLEDTEEQHTRFFVVRQAPDESLYEDAFRTTDAKTRYWMKRLRDVDREAERQHRTAEKPHEHHGVRVMLRFQRAGDAASIGDVESYLRNFGVRHQVVRLDEDSGKDTPAGMVLDIEFECSDFDGDIAYNGLAAIPYRFTKRLKGSVANGAMKLAFQRWKNRGVTVLAATPFMTPQLPKHQRRRWYWEMPLAWIADVVETNFIRLTRIAPYALLLMLAALIYFAMKAQGIAP